MKLLSSMKVQRQADKQAAIYRNLIRHAAKVGGQLFGEVKPGTRREFFCLDERTWIWHEEWTDTTTGKRRVVTTRYDVRPNGILKAQDGQGYRYLALDEALNLQRAVKLYNQRLDAEAYAQSV